MTKRTAFVNARLLDPASGLDGHGAVVVEGATIAEVAPGGIPSLFPDLPPDAVDVIDCTGLCLAPGLVDMRVRIGEPGAEHQETIATAGHAAAAGGITALACLPNTDPPIDGVAGLEFIARRAREQRSVKIFAQACLTRAAAGRELAELGLLSEAGAVAFTDGDRAVADSLMMMRALSYARTFDLLIVQHPEDPRLATNGQMNAGAEATRLGLTGIPPQAEVMMIERDLRLVEMTDCRYHAAHVSTASAVEAIRQAKRRGLPVTCDTAPPYFALSELDVGEYRTFAKLSPPLRSDADRRAIIAGLADGTIDAIASDHNPQDQDSKRLPFPAAAVGSVGLETLLPVSLDLVHNGHMRLLDVLHRLTLGPAKLLRLPLGRLARGQPADLVVFDPEAAWRVGADLLRSKSKNSAFDRRPVMGRVRRTMVDGRTVFSEPD